MGKLYRNPRKLLFTCLYLIATSIVALAQNPIVTENALPGNPESEWQVPDFRDIRIAGFANKMSLNAGSAVRFKINVQNAASYSIKIYRIGYYNGNGARLMQNLGIFSGVVQPAGISDASTGLIDCSNWSESASWAIPSNAVSGLYVAKLERTGGGSNHIAFIVRNDSRNSDLYFQFPDATWQAYNGYGGNSMYDGTTSWPSGHAVKVSYNRPMFPYNSLFNTDARQSDWYMNAEYPMIRWMERNGYDITYTSCNDVEKNGSRLLNHKVFISIGHDEYISKQQKANIEAARNAGVHLAFFSGNEFYWKTRWESSDGTEDRTLVCYKEGFLGDGSLAERTCGSKCDPSAEWTGLWRTGEDYDAGTPENKLTGQISWTEYPANILVPAFYKKIRLWRNTSVAALAPGQTASLGINTLGFEWDYEQPQYAASYPEGRFTASSTNANNLTHKLSLYRHSSGALVFGAGTVQWSWGLDGNHWDGSDVVSTAMQQATANLFADMGAQPGSLQSDLAPATQSTDFTAPSASFTSPANGSGFTSGVPINFTGGSTDAGGGVVASIEVSTDGGARWIPATLNSIDGTITWSYSWTPGSNGTYTIYARGVDDSGNIGSAVSITITIGSGGDVTPPIITSVSPLNREAGVSTTTAVIANFSEAINSSTVTAVTFQLRNATNNLVNASVSTIGNQIILTPSSVLGGSSTYTVTIVGGSSGVKDLAGNALVNNYTWIFTTAASGGGSGGGSSLFQPTDVPQSILVNDGQSIEVGMRFRTSQSGLATGIRFYKGAGATGSHVGSLWSNDGTLLAQATFVNETTSGWQQVLFSNPVAITPGVTYVVSCFSASGDYAASKPFFTSNLVNEPITGLQDGLDGPNGLYMYTSTPAFPTSSVASSNYWVDVVFNAGSDIIAPTVTSVLPANDATDVALNTIITANFSEAINSSTVTGSTFQLQDADNNLVNATVSTATSQISLTPATPLTNGTVYTVTIIGGASGVEDQAGNALANNYSWSFTTVSADNTAPTINIVSPASDATSVNVFSSISAIFSEAINSSTVNSTTFQVRDGSNNLVSGSVTVSGNQLTFNPASAFIAGTTYSVTIIGGAFGVMDLAGNALENNFAWSFTTANGIATYSLFQPTDVPHDILVNDGQGIEVGMRFRSTQDGFITGVRYYKGPGATGVHVGSLWTNTGTLLAQAAFITETPSGWQQVSFSNPVAITADVTYVISCFSPSGDYASSKPYFTDNLVNPPIIGLKDGLDGPNGLYMYTATSVFPTSSFQSSNYWVDVVYSATDGTGGVAPSVSTQPASQTLCAGATAAFTSAATGTPTPTVQWQVSTNGTNWTDIIGATNATLSFATVADDNGKQYRAVWTNNISTANSNAATLTINAIPAAPVVTVVNNCESSVLTASSFSGSLLWSNGATTAAITTTSAGTYTVTQTVNGCTSPAGSGSATPVATPGAPTVTVVNSCGSSTLTATGYTGSLLWSNGATTASITVTAAGTYTVTQKVNGCTSPDGSGTAAPVTAPAAPTVTVVNSCGSSTLTANGYTGTLLWSNGATTASITVTAAGTYTVAQSVNGCTSPAGGGTATPVAIPAAPTVTVVNSCGSSTLTANGYTGTLLWSNGATASSITVTTPGTYTVKQTVNGCTSAAGSGTASPGTSAVAAPNVKVANNCGSSTLTAIGYTGSLLWSNGATTASITVTAAGTYTVKQTLNGCASPLRSATAAPKTVPALTSALTKVITSGTSIAYTPTSNVAVSSFAWTRAAVKGIQNSASSGTGSISEALFNTTTSPVNVTYTYRLTGTNGCVKTQNIVVTVNPVNCTIENTSLTANFNSSPIPAGRYIWFYSSLNPSSIGWNTATFTINITNAVITFTANGVQYRLSVPNGKIRFEPNAWPAKTTFVNNTWETVVPRIFSDDIFMNGLAYRVPANLPGNISNVKWTANITIDKTNTPLSWRWSAAVYTVFTSTAGVKPKPVSGIFWDTYFNFDEAGTPQNYEQYLTSGARNSGWPYYSGNFVSSSSLNCSSPVGTRPGADADTTVHSNAPIVIERKLPEISVADKFGSKDLQAEVMPNPSSTFFNLVIKGSSESPVTVKILDMFGQVVETHQKVSSNTVLKIGHRLTSGSYFAEITQGNQRKVVRLIKAN